MSEEFLHHVYKFKLFNQLGLATTNGLAVEIIKAGEHNKDAGPDFFNARIKVDNTLWAGNVEVHINSSDWEKHNHQSNKAYNNIILHVVYNDDRPLMDSRGEAVPTIEIKNLIPQKLYSNYLNFKSNTDWIPCEKHFYAVPEVIVNSTLDRLLLERLERKSNAILNSLKLNNNNWEESFYQFLARNFGFNTNAVPFEILAKATPTATLAKHKNSLVQLEAILFGQAGFLEQHLDDNYLQLLQNEYTFLKKKYNLVPLDNHLWKFLRLRPVNFPTIRIAQFANLIFNSNHLFSKIMETDNLERLKSLINTDVSEYWQTHYMFDKLSTNKSKHFGDSAVNNIIINTVVPYLFVYGKLKDEQKYIERAITFLEQTKGESNSIINKWKLLNAPVKSAHSTQALLQLKKEYCDNKKCIDCTIGNYLLKNM